MGWGLGVVEGVGLEQEGVGWVLEVVEVVARDWVWRLN